MEPHRTTGPYHVFPGFGRINLNSSSFNIVSHANSHGVHPTYGYGSVESGEAFYNSAYIQNPAMLQAPSVPAPVAPCVHINPNYRPKVTSGFQPLVSNRPASVHINPHWKGRVESTFSKADHLVGEVHNSQTQAKKTIFVNPKVLSQLHLKQPPHPVDSGPASLHTTSVPSSATNIENKKTVMTERTDEYHKKTDLENSVTEPSFVILNSRKLVRKTNSAPVPSSATNIENRKTVMTERTDEYHKKTDLENSVTEPSFVILNSRKLVRKTNSAHRAQYLKVSSFDVIKKSPIACTSTVKLARQVASKYKLVRNPPIIQNVLKTVNSVPSTYSRRSRRKSINPSLSSTTNSKSVYKFIRQTAGTKPLSEESVKVGKKFDQLIVLPSASIQRENPNLRRSLKSRYRLIKTQPSIPKEPAASVENFKAKGVHSRYKLVRHGLLESKSSFRNSSMCSFSLYSSPMRSKLRSFNGNRPSFGRKVSRFSIIQNSVGNNGTQALMTERKSYTHSNNTKSQILKSGLYKNISWQKERTKPLTHPSSYEPTVRSRKNSSQRNGITLSSKKVPNKSLVNIGGVLYRSTRTTLTRTCTRKVKERILHIRGRKFVMDGKGKTIRPASSSEDGSCASKGRKLFARVDIGGVTFTRRSDNTLVRTNTHHARNILSLAKMRSIALLTDKLRKNNQPCLIYHRFGKCLSHIKGKCWRVHDPRNISICRKFLQGLCESEKCLLSHDVGPEKMPTCRYFLEGCCVRDNCPYLHVKLSANAAICRQFLHGYCVAGDMCKKRHVFVCPEFEKDEKCSKGKYCPYPHVNSAKHKHRNQRSTVTKNLKDCSNLIKDNCERDNKLDKTASLREIEKVKRYYDESSPCETSNKASLDCDGSDSEMSSCFDEDTDGKEGSLRRRSKIGILPAYIPL